MTRQMSVLVRALVSALVLVHVRVHVRAFVCVVSYLIRRLWEAQRATVDCKKCKIIFSANLHRERERNCRANVNDGGHGETKIVIAPFSYNKRDKRGTNARRNGNVDSNLRRSIFTVEIMRAFSPRYRYEFQLRLLILDYQSACGANV